MEHHLTPVMVLTAYKVQYADMRQAKPRDVHTDTYVLDACTVGALNRTGQAVPDFIRRRYELGGFHVISVERDSTRQTALDLQALWKEAAQ